MSATFLLTSSDKPTTTAIMLAYMLSLLPKEFPQDIKDILGPEYPKTPAEYLRDTIDNMCSREWHSGHDDGFQNGYKQAKKEQRKLEKL